MKAPAKSTKSKSDSQRIHAKRRFDERYGIKLTQFVWDNLLHKINTRQVKLVKKQSLRVFIYDIDLPLREKDITGFGVSAGIANVRVVFDKFRGNIVSALPQDADISEENW